MNIARTINSERDEFPKGSSVCIGVFDGIHLGHQELIRRMTQFARVKDLSSILFTFEPSPNEYFSKGKPQPKLTTLEEKNQYLRKSEIDCLYCPPFDQDMENLSPLEFVKQHLISKSSKWTSKVSSVPSTVGLNPIFANPLYSFVTSSMIA